MWIGIVSALTRQSRFFALALLVSFSIDITNYNAISSVQPGPLH